MCLTKIPTHGIFKLLSVIIFHCGMQFLVEKISALLYFLDGLGITVLVFSY